MNVALIDDGVEINNVTRQYIYEFLEINDILVGFQKQTTNINSYSHGTICASIIRKMSQSARIYSLKILNSDNLCASTCKLEKAFEWCLNNDIDIINLSLGTINSKDFISIKRWIRCLIKNNKIVVAAINNNNSYTIPASLPEVIGVSSEEKLCDFKFVSDSFIGIDILAPSNYDIVLNNEEHIITPFCNSFAAPAVTGKICELISKDYNSMGEKDKYFVGKIREKLRIKCKDIEFESMGDMVKCELNEKYLWTNHCDWNNNTIKKVPIINIYSSAVELNMFNKLFYNDNIFPVVVYGKYILSNMKKRRIYNLLYKISGMMDCDLIVLHNITGRLVDEEISIEYCSLEFKITYRKGLKKVRNTYRKIETVYEKILDVLG